MREFGKKKRKWEGGRKGRRKRGKVGKKKRRWEEEKITRSEDLKERRWERRREEWGSSIREDRWDKREDGKKIRIMARKRREGGET